MKIVDERTPKRTKLRVRTCPICGCKYGTHRKEKKTCSKECGIRLGAQKTKSGKYRKCEKCGKEFWSTKSADKKNRCNKRRYCSLLCSRKDPSIPIGRYISHDGYWIISHNGKPQTREHRVVYEAYYGKIPKGFVVHHLNGDKLDNRIENLVAMSRSDHNKVHKFLEKEEKHGWKEKTRKANQTPQKKSC